MRNTLDQNIPPSPGATDQLHFASLEPVRLGMPELCRAGLSESWLLKACGHRHWLALAAAHGLPRPDFRTVDGARLYPAFTSVRLSGGNLGAVGEDDLLCFAVTLTRIGYTRFRSTIAVSCGEIAVAHLVMESAFVERTIAGRNHSASRAPVARPCALLPPVRGSGSRLSSAARPGSDRVEIASCLFDPSPHEDFNGADFLYFAAFQAMADRAEWRWLPRSEPLLVTEFREITYLGNIELGEQVRVALCKLDEGSAFVDHTMEFYRSSDDRLIAFATSRRRATRSSSGRDTQG